MGGFKGGGAYYPYSYACVLEDLRATTVNSHADALYYYSYARLLDDLGATTVNSHADALLLPTPTLAFWTTWGLLL